MIELKGISKTFEGEDHPVVALDDVSLTIGDGARFGIIGASGAGKSTLLRCINLLERPDSGEVIVDGTDLMGLSKAQLREKRKGIGIVFQRFNLLPQKRVSANIRYPLDIGGVPRDEAESRVQELLDLIGLADKASEYPSRLSGGQQQRVAIARAIASKPDILLCDECTSALDPATTESILSLLEELNSSTGMTLVVVTHEMAVVERLCDEVAVMEHGSVIGIDRVDKGYDGLTSMHGGTE